MYRSTIFLFFALFATVFGAYQPTGCGKGQKRKDVIMIRDQFENSKLVCNWYLGNKRNIVPTAKTFVDVKSKRAIKRFSNACECISKRRQSNRPTVKRFRPDGYTPTCQEGARKLLLQEVKQPLNFCNMWNQQSWRKPSAVPFGGNLSARQIYNACVCVAQRRASTSTSSDVPVTTEESTSTEESTAEPTEEPTSTDESTPEPTADPTSDVITTTTTTDATTTTAPLIVLPTTTIDLLPTTTIDLLPTTTTTATTSDSTTTTSTTSDSTTTTSTTSSTTTSATTTSTTTSTTTQQPTTTSTTTVTTTITATPTFTTTRTSTSSSSSSTSSAGGMKRREAVAHAGRQYSNAGKRAVLLDN